VVAGGRFSYRLGSKTALDAAVLAALKTPFLGVTVGSEPELPRQPLDAAPYAVLAGTAQTIACTGCIGGDQLGTGAVASAKVGFNYAASSTKGGPALDLVCTGCVSVSELVFDGDLDLGGNSVKGKNATFAGDIVGKTVTATGFVGDGSKLTGLALPSGACPDGEAVVAIAADGKLVCKAVSAALLPDGLNEVSNELLSNQFQDVITAKDKAVAIPDNTGAEGVSELVFPDIGVAQTFSIKLEVSNTDLSTLALQLLPPDDKKTGYTLCDPCGDKDSKTLTLELPKTKPQTGDLATWLGKNPKGLWTLKAKDTGFCLIQAPGNDKLCNVTAKTDGELIDWSIAIQTLSSKKVQVAGRLIVQDGLTLQKSEKAALICDADHHGTLYWDGGTIQVCTPAGLFPIAVGQPGSEANPGASCKDIRTKVATAKDGIFWVDADGFGGSAPFQVTCDMTTDGGGWTKVSEYAETYYANLAERGQLAYQDVLILEYDHSISPPLLKQNVSKQTCYNSAKKGFHTQAAASPHCDTGIHIRIGGKGGSCGDAEDGCFGIYKGNTVFGAATGCNWDCGSGAVTIWGKGYACNSCRCRNTPATTIAGCGNGGAWGTLRHWIFVR
jgi:hypothetical protein